MVENRCLYEINASFGEVLVVDEDLSLQASEKLCNDLSAKLPPLHNQSMITEITTHLKLCNATGYHGAPHTVPRNIMKWRIGLTTNYGQGNWSDGQVYDALKDGFLFKDHYQPKKTGFYGDSGCENAVIDPMSGKLRTSECDRPQPFICLREPGAKFIKTPRANHQEEAYPPRNCDHQEVPKPDYQEVVIGVLSAICLLLFLLHVFLIVRKVAKRIRIKQGEQTIENGRGNPHRVDVSDRIPLTVSFTQQGSTVDGDSTCDVKSRTQSDQVRRGSDVIHLPETYV